MGEMDSIEEDKNYPARLGRVRAMLEMLIEWHDADGIPVSMWQEARDVVYDDQRRDHRIDRYLAR